MKNNLLATLLSWVLAMSLIMSVVFFIQFYFRTKQLRAQSAVLQTDMARLQYNRTLMSSLVNDLAEYSRTHPAIDPVLESIGFRMNRTNTTQAKPAAK